MYLMRKLTYTHNSNSTKQIKTISLNNVKEKNSQTNFSNASLLFHLCVNKGE